MNEARSETISIDTDGGKFNGFLAQSDPAAPRILLFHAWWGLTPIFQDLALRLANEGFSVLAPDLFDGVSVGTIQQAEALEQHHDQARHNFIAESAVRWMRQQPSNFAGLGVIGFSLGGAWSLALAGKFPEIVKAVVLFYASGEADYARVRARVQGHFGGRDEWTPQADIDTMEKEMRANSIQYQFFHYPEASHWFCERNRPEYRAEDAALAWQRSVKFLQEELKE